MHTNAEVVTLPQPHMLIDFPYLYKISLECNLFIVNKEMWVHFTTKCAVLFFAENAELVQCKYTLTLPH